MTTCIDTIGVYKAVLYNNQNMRFRRPDITKENEVDLVSYSGGAIIVEYEDLPKWTRERTTGANYKEMFTDSIEFYMKGFNENNNTILKALRENKNGWILELQLINKQNIMFQSPVFLSEAVTFDFNNGVHKVNLSYRVPTFKDYLTKLNDLIFAYSFLFFGTNAVAAYDNSNPIIIND